MKEDENVEFLCQVSKKDVKVKWSLNGQRLIAADNIKMLADEDKRILKIKKCQLSDAGKISCNLPGDKSSKANLTVEEVPIDIKMDSIEVFEKEDAKLEALLSKELAKRDVTWSFNSSKIGESLKYNQECEKELLKHRLVVRDCTLEDSGEYKISARNDKFTVKLLVKELPCKFGKPLSDQNPTEHNNVSFDVNLTKPNHKVKWFLNGNELAENDKYSPKQVDKTRFSLEIKDVLLTDEGVVKCVVFNDKDEEIASSECKLTVKEIPLDIDKGLSNKRCMETEEVKFECVLNKEVNPEDIGWFRDGMKLKDGDENGRIQLISEGPKQYLVVKNSNLDDSGNYEMRIKGVKSSASLKVKGKSFFNINCLAIY